MSEEQRTNMIDYLKIKTDYSFNYLIKLPDSKLYSIYANVYKYINKYIQEIEEYQNSHFLLQKYTKNELEKMTYGSLINTRKKYGIGIKKKIDKEIEIDDSYDQEMEYLTYEELYEMYGDDSLDYNDKEIHKNGIILDRDSSINFKKRQQTNEIKETIINFIIRAKITNNYGEKYKKQYLDKLSFEDIKRIYENFSASNPNRFPEYYDTTNINRLYKRK